MKILFISEYYPPKIKGGGEINLSTLVTTLAKAGHTITVLTSYFPGLPAAEEQEGIKIYRRLKTGENPGSIRSNLTRSLLFPFSVKRETKKIVPEINPDVIHFIGTSIIAAPTLKSLNKPLFATIESYPTLCPKGDRWYHGKEECKIVCSLRKFASCQKDSDEIGKMKNKWYLKYNLFFLAYTYYYYKKMNKALSYCTLLSISGYVQQLLLQQNHHSQVIPNILDLHPFSWAKRKDKPKKEDRKVRILYLGSLLKSKGPQILLEALKGINCRCDLYGEGNLKPELQNIIEKNELDAEIHPPVPYEKIPKLYADTDIVVFPSIWPEPFGRIAIESMAAGKVIIASNIGAIPEIVGEKGIVVSPGDVQELRAAIITAISTAPKQKAVLSYYGSSAVISHLLQMYEERL